MLPVDEDELHFQAMFLCSFVTTSFLFHTSDPLQKIKLGISAALRFNNQP